jgi:hypothetical protein
MPTNRSPKLPPRKRGRDWPGSTDLWKFFCARSASHTTLLTWYYCPKSISRSPCACISNREAAADRPRNLIARNLFQSLPLPRGRLVAAAYQIGGASDRGAAQRGCHGFPLDGADMSDRICAPAWSQPGATEVTRGENLHACDDARLMARKLNREWPGVDHRAAPATGRELAAHAAQAARLRKALSAA